MSEKLFCPEFIYDICIGLTVKDFLVKQLSLDMVSKNYADAISNYYKNVEEVEIASPSEEILRFISERKNPMFEAHELAMNYVFWKFKYDGRSERKIKGIFKNSLKGDKERQYNSNKSVKNFKAYSFSLRSGHFEKAPAGWDIAKEEDLQELGEIVKKEPSIDDFI
ncbi:MAG: hypothetical protein CBC25_02360 [Pelagibacteraceae bacterium TMED65]|nr:hypothetical protein [Rickettsiales bacterium]OUU52743.1 MAG: hypothetical protein CBC25_02360 [Pelagibacteraceae bacterium TMED65]